MSATVEEIAGVVNSSALGCFEGWDVNEVGNALDQILHIEDQKDKAVYCAEMFPISTEVEMKTSSANIKCQRSLDRSATFSSPSRVPYIDTARKIAMTATDRSLSLPCSFKLVSAMKGSREVEGGTSPKTKMHVTWAPDVYDPPVTSVSHSVKSYNQRHYFNKKKDRQHKHKNRKGKGTRDGNNDKKHQQRQSDPSRTRLLTPKFSGELPSGDFAKSGASVAESCMSSGSSSDSKCGNSSFLRASLGNLLYSVAEV